MRIEHFFNITNFWRGHGNSQSGSSAGVLDRPDEAVNESFYNDGSAAITALRKAEVSFKLNLTDFKNT